MATQAERMATLESGMAALLAHLGGNAAAVESDDSEETRPKGKASNAAKGKVLNIPTHTVTADDGVRWRFTQAYRSSPKNGEPVIYRTPRILVEVKGPNDDDFRKTGHTLTAEEMAAVRSIPDAKIDALSNDAREA